MSSRLLLSLFIHGFPSTLFSFRTTFFSFWNRKFHALQTFQTEWDYYYNKSSLDIHNSCSIKYPVFCQYSPTGIRDIFLNTVGGGSSPPALGISCFVTLHCNLQVEQGRYHDLGGAIILSHLRGNEHTRGYIFPHKGLSYAPEPPPLPLLDPSALFLLPLLSSALESHVKRKMRPYTSPYLEKREIR